VYSDLLGPAPDQPGKAGPAAPGQLAAHHPAPAHHPAAAPPVPDSAPGTGSPPGPAGPGGATWPAPPGVPPLSPSGSLPQQRSAAEDLLNPPDSTGSAPATSGQAGDEPDKHGLPVGVIVGLVLIGATVLVLGALSVPFLLDRLNDAGSATYTVGDCVTQDGEAARTVECTEPDAYLIVAEVDSRDQCTDPTQPAIEVAGPPAQFYCLVPATAAPTE
jgi:hypothetical protein